MNTDTGRIYRTPQEIEAAKARGEPLVEVPDLAAEAEAQIERLSREERRIKMHNRDSGGSHAQRRPLHAGKRR